jgi:pimeloyl-ACP methyl ester carboxylesterase
VLVRTALEVIFHDRRRITADMVEAYARPLREPGGRHALVETTRLLVPPDNPAVAALYPALRLPVLILWGRHDAVLPLSLGERLAASLPGARLAVVEAAGHAPQEERPEATLAALAPLLPG